MNGRNQFCGLTQHERFVSFVMPEPNSGCWLWMGSLQGNGGLYGTFYYGKRLGKAHRYAYEYFKGPIPVGLVIDHICRVTQCVNPDHLRAVTQRENILFGEGRAAKQARQTFCISGHELNAINTYVKPNGARQCKVCRRATDVLRYAADPEKRLAYRKKRKAA